ncbi:hypothetical protein Poly51_61990 [Rubripirellula tenax]|uniref:Uncharacterized protein n=1 Tax=Rubripirellula tenax TaxID=2528015 RepID=A0A5C6E6T8_9BACT|nr:hypothetical protein Poly51_61990 [Rubripirellula tenax]
MARSQMENQPAVPGDGGRYATTGSHFPLLLPLRIGELNVEQRMETR